MLTLTHVTKSFGTTRAIDDVSLHVDRGEIVGIVGENGAGKTTLMRVIAGELASDSGTADAIGRAELVHQHFMLVSNFTIAENLALSSTPLFSRTRFFRTRRSLEQAADRTIAASGIELADVSRLVEQLSVGERSKLELIKAISKAPDILILDEPTSVLTPEESAELFRVIERLAAAGTSVLFISHKLREVLAVAQRIVVMRAGRIVAETKAHGMTADALATAMVGERSATAVIDAGAVEVVRPSDERDRAPAPGSVPDTLDDSADVRNDKRRGPKGARDRSTRTVALRCDRVSGERLEEVDLDVISGEIVAIVGVAGNGQSELAALLRGLSSPRAGSIVLDGRRVSRRTLLRTARIGHIPEDRARDGVVAQMSIAENIALTAPWPVRHSKRLAQRLVDLYAIRARSASQIAGALSGGNQQKVVLARELDRRPAVIVAAEPTRGLDIAAARFVHEQLHAAAAAGSGILLITSDLDEAFALATALHVIYRGRLSGRLSPAEASARIATLMAGVA